MKNSKTKIAFFINSLGGGGAEKIMTTLLDNLDSEKYDISLLLTYENVINYGVCSRIKIQSYDFESIQVKWVVVVIIKLLAMIRCIPYIFNPIIIFIKYKNISTDLLKLYSRYALAKHYLDKNKPDVVVSFLFHSSLIAILCKLFSGSKFKVICSDHCTLSKELVNFFPLTYKILPRLAFKRIDGYVAVSAGVARDLFNNFRLPMNKISVIYNGVDIDSIFKSASMPVEATVERLFLDDRFTIVNVGRLAPPKNQRCLLDAFCKVREQLPCRLILIGQGELYDELKCQAAMLGIEKDVYFLGWQTNPYNIMKKCDLFVLSSSWEAFPNVLIEAMAVGLPIVSTDCPTGPSEALSNGKYGDLVPVEDSDVLASAIIKMHNDKSRRQKFAILGRERAFDFGLLHMISAYEKLIDEVAVESR
ncbi:MAG TPA: glycosyltransferase [Nitrosomonas sp.]|nr:glycosyltransferase [Nitrosomonas sp.]